MKNFLEKLNKEQYEAATTVDGPLLIIAGAGSGKTMTLVSRVGHMINEGVDPSSILLLTFTNKAAKEMKSRIVKNVGEAAEDVTACTFHSFCANFLRKHAHLIDISNDFNILDGTDSVDAMALVRQDFVAKQKAKKITYGAKDFPTKQMLSKLYSIAINNCQPLEEVVAKYELMGYLTEIRTMLNEYYQYKKKHSMLDYDDLLFYTKKILETHEDVRAKIDEKYKYISCDEYQDTNVIQDAILDLMSRDYNNLAVVGDDNQSIYKFRCANIENILTFSKRHPGCKTVILNQNYRSSQEILDLANSVMDYATEGIKKELKGQFRHVEPMLVQVGNQFEEANYIVAEIKELNRLGTPLRDIAVIIRGSSQSYILESMLNQEGIPFEKFGGLKFLEKAIVKDILAFLRVSVNSKDELALHRILQLYPGIGIAFAKKIAEGVSSGGIEALTMLYPKRQFAKYLKEMFLTIEKLKKMSVNAQLKYIIEEYYPEAAVRSITLSKIEEGEKMELKKELFEQLKDATALYQMAANYKTTVKFLEDLALEATAPDDNEDKLNITTIHSAKGLEYEAVFLMDVIEQVTPRTAEGDEEDPEELRCFYVALTRAKRKLWLFAPREYGGYCPITRTMLSHFINKNNIIDCLRLE